MLTMKKTILLQQVGYLERLLNMLDLKAKLILTVLLLFLLACFYWYFYLYFNLVQLRSVILYTPNCITI